MSGSYRYAKLVPWYHVNRPQCQTLTLRGEQCIFSARFETSDGRTPVCKVHADMLALDGRKVRLLQARRVDLRA